MNKAMLIGNLGADPELRYTQGGAPVTNFRMATNESWNDREGGKQERTEWHRIVVFGKLAEICNNYLRKGRQVYVEGRLQTRNWDDDDGNKRYATEIIAREVKFLGVRGDYQGGGNPAGQDWQPSSDDGRQIQHAATQQVIPDEDCPF